MKISSIQNIKNKYLNFNHKTGEKKQLSPSFLARPEYDYFEKRYTIRASSHFRRGQHYGTPAYKYKDIQLALEKILSEKQKPSMLFVGLGQGEEMFSVMASVYSIKNQPKKLSKIVEVEGVELGPKLTEEDIEHSSYFQDINALEDFDYGKVKNAFLPEKKENRGIWYAGVQFKPEITNFVKKTLNSKVHWDTSIQEFLAKNKKTYDMFIMNNVLLYIEDEKEKVATLKQAKEIINSKGIIITDPKDDFYKFYHVFDDWTRLADGIYQKP